MTDLRRRTNPALSACSKINRVIKVLSAACISVGRPGRSSMSPVVFRGSPAKDRSAAIARGGAASSAGAWPLLASGRGRVLVRPNARHSVVQRAGSRAPPFSGKPPQENGRSIMPFVRSAKEQIFSHGDVGKQARLQTRHSPAPACGWERRRRCDPARPLRRYRGVHP
jgi:hypothetical protein